MRTRRLPPVPALFLFRVFVVFHLLGMPAAIGFFTPDLLRADERDTGISGRAVSGRVLSATDAKPLAGVVLTLAGQISTTDATGRFTFKQPSSGYQLMKIQHASLNAYRKPLKNGTLAGSCMLIRSSSMSHRTRLSNCLTPSGSSRRMRCRIP